MRAWTIETLAGIEALKLVEAVSYTHLDVYKRQLITRSIANLLGNAIKYSDEETKVRARVLIEGDEVVCDIIDEGRGIAAEDLPQLFEAFSRLAPPEGAPAATAAPGAGLGLAFVKAVLERHPGRVTVTSPAGAGSSFGFRLPRVRLD